MALSAPAAGRCQRQRLRTHMTGIRGWSQGRTGVSRAFLSRPEGGPGAGARVARPANVGYGVDRANERQRARCLRRRKHLRPAAAGRVLDRGPEVEGAHGAASRGCEKRQAVARKQLGKSLRRPLEQRASEQQVCIRAAELHRSSRSAAQQQGGRRRKASGGAASGQRAT